MKGWLGKGLICCLLAGCGKAAVCDVNTLDSALVAVADGHRFEAAGPLMVAVADACSVPTLRLAERPVGVREGLFAQATLDAPSHWQAVCSGGTSVVEQTRLLEPPEPSISLVDACNLGRYGVDQETVTGWGTDALMRIQAVGMLERLDTERRLAIRDVLMAGAPNDELVLHGLKVQYGVPYFPNRMIPTLEYGFYGVGENAPDVRLVGHATCELDGKRWMDRTLFDTFDGIEGRREGRGSIEFDGGANPPSLNGVRSSQCEYDVVTQVKGRLDAVVGTYCWNGTEVVDGGCLFTEAVPEGGLQVSLMENSDIRRREPVNAWFELHAGSQFMGSIMPLMAVECPDGNEQVQVHDEFLDFSVLQPGDRSWLRGYVPVHHSVGRDWPLGCDATVRLVNTNGEFHTAGRWCIGRNGMQVGSCQ